MNWAIEEIIWVSLVPSWNIQKFYNNPAILGCAFLSRLMVPKSAIHSSLSVFIGWSAADQSYSFSDYPTSEVELTTRSWAEKREEMGDTFLGEKGRGSGQEILSGGWATRQRAKCGGDRQSWNSRGAVQVISLSKAFPKVGMASLL